MARTSSASRAATASNGMRRPPMTTDRSVRALGADLGALGHDRDPVVVDGQEAAVHPRGHLLTLAGDPDLALDQYPEQRRVTGQDADLAVGGAGHDARGVAAPDLAVGGDEFN